ncbi:hypothetical protein LHYA1_G002247 [Lachnellula hyalina]|uniref:Serine-rich protein n=1 Tax=Lachnellula hyalina TaxID=1316788 RepID=A0A8H8U3E4_9HELO|nr:uncharacterized protein LHYA1_G002247 [Lachnellula hyalina]TVY29051.1 hypothetical protein LHYA1_G002247 [Lachnellula hyalina]
MSEGSPSRQPLHERSNSQSNKISAIRLVPSTPPRLLGQEKEERDEVYGRTPLPTHPSHILLAPGHGRGKDKDPTPALAPEFQTTSKAQGEAISSGSPVSTHITHHLPQNADSATGSTISKPKRLPKKGSKKRLQIHKDSKTFSLLQDDPQPVQDTPKSPTFSIPTKSSYDSLASEALHAEARSNSIDSCLLPLTPATPASEGKQPISADHISSSPWNYQLVGGLRKVPKTPDIKQKSTTIADSPLPPLPPLPEVYDLPSAAASHDLSAKPSFRSTQTTTTTSENTNYKVYGNTSDSASEVAIQPPSSNNSNYQVFGDPSEADTASSVIHRPQTGYSENENYELHGDPSLTGSSVNLVGGKKYSQESLVVPPLRPRANRSNESFGYYKSRSRESLRTGSLTSISTVLSQQEAAQAVVGSGSLIQLPISNRAAASSSWAENTHPLRSHMNEQPHQWSSQLSTVLSVSEGTERGSRSWSDDSGRMSGGFPSTPSRTSRNSRQMLSISSSLQREEGRSESPISPPDPAFTRGGRRHQSSSSVPVVGDQDEHGDGITDMQDLRARPSRTRLSGFFSTTSSDNGRSNTMRSSSSSRANSLVSSSIPTWAKLYYGSGERRYLGTPGAPGSSTEGTDSRSGSFTTGSPNTDHFPLSIYSPRRRPRGVHPNIGRPSARGSLEITPAPLQENNDPDTRRFRTWSLSSVWSPHLRHDRRATGHSMWDPPSISWSTDGRWFAWMIAAFLPLPLNPMTEMRERDVENSTSNLDNSNDYANDFARQFGPVDEIRFESAKWWRNLNRWMSIVGLLIIAAVVVLVVIGVREGWTKS